MKIFNALLCLFVTTALFGQSIVTYKTSDKPHEISSYYDAQLKPFYHGVASGDPLSNAVIIWTRVTPEVDAPIEVEWRVATDKEMSNIVATGTATTNIIQDYTVKVDVTGLAPATTYYYDFFALDASSIIGRTRTAPAGDVDNVRIAVISCSNYQEGYFNTYKEIASRNDLDVVIHLGDYIYEYETGGYGYSEEIDRKHLPDNEIVSLEDYRIRYSYYRLDPDLRAAHQQHPFVTVWDDHEFTNDSYIDGAGNHNEGEGDWETRKANAFEAYFDWLPIRENAIEPNRIYRKISYGNLADIFMLDTRMEGREKQIDLFSTMDKIAETSTLDRNSIEAQTKEREIKDVLRLHFKRHYSTTDKQTSDIALTPDEVSELVDFTYNQALNNLKNFKEKKMLPQTGAKNIEKSKVSRIKYLVNKGTSSPIKIETENASTVLEKSSTSTNDKLINEWNRKPKIYSDTQEQWLLDGLVSSNAKWKVLGNQTMFFPLVPPVNQDQWDGYSKSREEILETIHEYNIENTVVITGDIHTSWAAEVPRKLFNYSFFGQDPLAVEFITPSITSANGSVLGSFLASVGDFVLNLLNPHVKSVNLSQHGYFLLDLNHKRAKAVWQFIDIDSPEYEVRDGFSYLTQSGSQRLTETGSYLPSRNIGEPSSAKPSSQKLAADNKQDMLVVGLYPNPVQSHTQLHYALNSAAEILVSVYNTQGVMVKQFNASQPKGTYSMILNLDNIKSGNYMVQITANGEKVATKKIIKK